MKSKPREALDAIMSIVQKFPQGDIVRECMDKTKAVVAIKQKAFEAVALDDQARFVEVIEVELMSLHKGNIARFRLRPSEYDEWLKTWR